MTIGRGDSDRHSVPFTRDLLDGSLSDRFEQIVALLPTHLAVKSDANAVTYIQLNAAANRLAREIVRRTSSAPVAVALLLTRGVNSAVGTFGVIKSGNYFVPIDPSFPKSRIAHIIKHSGAELVVADAPNVALAREVLRSDAVIDMDAIDVNGADDNLGLRIAPTALATLIYTSGSTGVPKGVMVDHRALLHNGMVQGMIASVAVNDRVTLLTAGTGNAISTTVFTLMAGATLCPFDVAAQGVSRMADWLLRERISIALIASPLFRRFCESLRQEVGFPDVRILRLTSDTVYQSDVELYRRHFSRSCTFVNALNATETGPICAYHIEHDAVLADDELPVGDAVPDKQLLVVDDAGQEVGPNKLGEIVVRSRYLTRGYWRNPELTAARFKPQSGCDGEVLYYTGDLGVMLPDGRVIHKGRKDFRVKVRGYGVDILEVQKSLVLHPDVNDAVVVALKGDGGELSLVAYFTSRIQPPPDVTTLRSFLSRHLAAYMLPSQFVALRALPLTSNGKINRAALRMPHPPLRREGASVAPRNVIENRLVSTWSKVLGIHPIGITDDFFELGGDSLTAVALSAAIETRFDVELVPGILVEAPTIEKLARYISAQHDKQYRRDGYLVEMQRGDGRTPVFLVPGGVGGNDELFVYTRLARHTGACYPFYGFKARSAEGTESSQSSVEEIAADYVAAMRSLQPSGPYFLVGGCAGGIIAHEMAHQLHEEGEHLALLLLMDTPRPDSWQEARRGLARVVRESPIVTAFVEAIQEMRHRPMRDKVDYLALKGGKFARLLLRKCWGPPQKPSVERNIVHVQRSYSRTIYAHRPKRYPGKLTLILHKERGRTNQRAMAAWEDYALEGVQLHAVPGTHESFIREHVQTAAACLRACLENAESKHTVAQSHSQQSIGFVSDGFVPPQHPPTSWAGARQPIESKQ